MVVADAAGWVQGGREFLPPWRPSRGATLSNSLRERHCGGRTGLRFPLPTLALREQLSSLDNREPFRICARLGLHGGGGDGYAAAQATQMTLRMLAERIEQLTGQIDELNQRLTRLVERHPHSF
ncbi:hypothetical protein [Streptomyces sp. NPDC060035]|uniref:hypothetical protein n=1 Tax=Streptomyces sp. NPDC060035 TaxID=3347044 RepID=UPI0036861CA1